MKSFASDTYATAHPRLLKVLETVNVGHEPSYGGDRWTAKLDEQVKTLFGKDATGFTVLNGTGANLVALSPLLKSHHAVLCSSAAHINFDECGAGERFLGVKLIGLPFKNGKLTPADIEPQTKFFGSEHQAQGKVLCLTQATEKGTTYKIPELQALAEFSKRHGIRVCVDGARLSNAAASLGVGVGEIARASGAEILSFGGTKNGLVIGDLVVVLNPALADEIKFIRKQAMQLSSKMRFISAQLCEYLESGLYLENASHANAMAKLLAEKLKRYPEIKITEPVEANGVFAIPPRQMIAPLQEKYPFYVWDEPVGEVRWMCSFDTNPGDVDGFVSEIDRLLSNKGKA